MPRKKKKIKSEKCIRQDRLYRKRLVEVVVCASTLMLPNLGHPD